MKNCVQDHYVYVLWLGTASAFGTYMQEEDTANDDALNAAMRGAAQQVCEVSVPVALL